MGEGWRDLYSPPFVSNSLTEEDSNIEMEADKILTL